ncbi:MAG: hypothetical protein HQ536_01045 [Parcubacteria group bacterium]|nr:hypothetical protein [Parcubacteria group bacterium]
MTTLYAEIIPSLRLPKQFKTFDYILPDELKENVCAGSIVFIPFGKKTVLGVVVKIKEKSEIKNLKPIKSFVKDVVLPDDLIRTVFWMGNNLDVSLPLALKTILPDIPKKYAANN